MARFGPGLVEIAQRGLSLLVIGQRRIGRGRRTLDWLMKLDQGWGAIPTVRCAARRL